VHGSSAGGRGHFSAFLYSKEAKEDEGIEGDSDLDSKEPKVEGESRSLDLGAGSFDLRILRSEIEISFDSFEFKN
jgi:hypothetical protein